MKIRVKTGCQMRLCFKWEKRCRQLIKWRIQCHAVPSDVAPVKCSPLQELPWSFSLYSPREDERHTRCWYLGRDDNVAEGELNGVQELLELWGRAVPFNPPLLLSP